MIQFLVFYIIIGFAWYYLTINSMKTEKATRNTIWACWTCVLGWPILFLFTIYELILWYIRGN